MWRFKRLCNQHPRRDHRGIKSSARIKKRDCSYADVFLPKAQLDFTGIFKTRNLIC